MSSKCKSHNYTIFDVIVTTFECLNNSLHPILYDIVDFVTYDNA